LVFSLPDSCGGPLRRRVDVAESPTYREHRNAPRLRWPNRLWLVRLTRVAKVDVLPGPVCNVGHMARLKEGTLRAKHANQRVFRIGQRAGHSSS
jgi:hypothetical protein